MPEANAGWSLAFGEVQAHRVEILSHASGIDEHGINLD